MKTISLRRFRDAVRELNEPTEVGVRDPDGNFQILGYWTPYATTPDDATPLTPFVSGPGEAIVLPLDVADGIAASVGRVIRTPGDAAAAVQSARPFSKADQARRRHR